MIHPKLLIISFNKMDIGVTPSPNTDIDGRGLNILRLRRPKVRQYPAVILQALQLRVKFAIS